MISEAVSLARLIYDGDFILDYFFSQHLNVIQFLDGVTQSPRGEVILLHGSSGCGITNVLRRLCTLKPKATNFLRGDIYLERSDFVDHLCDAYYVRRGYHQSVPPHLLRVLSLTKRKAVLIDDLDIYISSERDLDQALGVMGDLSSGFLDLTFILSTRNERLLARYLKYAKYNWSILEINSKVTELEYYDFASRLWGGLNARYSQDVVDTVSEDFKPRYGLELQDVNRALRLSYVESTLRQYGAVEFLSDFDGIEEYEAYIHSIIYS